MPALVMQDVRDCIRAGNSPNPSLLRQRLQDKVFADVGPQAAFKPSTSRSWRSACSSYGATQHVEGLNNKLREARNCLPLQCVAHMTTGAAALWRGCRKFYNDLLNGHMRSWVGAVHRVGDRSVAFTKPLTVALPSCGLCDGATDLTTLRSERGSFKSTVHGCILGCFFGSSCITSCVHKDLQLSSNCSACVAGLAGCMKDHCFGNCVTSPTGSPCRDCLWSECLPQASNCTGIPKRVLFDLFQGSG